MTNQTNHSKPVCELCGEPMPEGEEMFRYHGYSGPCPKPAKSDNQPPAYAGNVRIVKDGHHAKLVVGDIMIPCYSIQLDMNPGDINTATLVVPVDKVDVEVFQNMTVVMLAEQQSGEDETPNRSGI